MLESGEQGKYAERSTKGLRFVCGRVIQRDPQNPLEMRSRKRRCKGGLRDSLGEIGPKVFNVSKEQEKTRHANPSRSQAQDHRSPRASRTPWEVSLTLQVAKNA